MTDTNDDITPEAQTSPEGTAAPEEPQASDPAEAAVDAPEPEVSDGPAIGEATQADARASAPEFAELQPEAGAGGSASLAMLYDLMMPVSVELGRTAMSVRDVLGLGRGSVIPLNRLAGEPIDIYVSDRKLAEGEVVVLGDHFGVRLTRVHAAGAAVAGASLAGQGA